jgi:serine O-acetyltransferase
MDLNKWLNNKLPLVADELDEKNQRYLKNKSIGFAGKESVIKVIHDLQSALFPNVYAKYPVDETRVNIFIGNALRSASIDLVKLVKNTLINVCELDKKGDPNCTNCLDKAEEITIKLLEKMPKIREMLQKDIKAAFIGDPAAISIEEIVLSYPSFEALSIFRLAHELYNLEVPLIPRIMTEYAHQKTGIDIHPGAQIGESFFIDHGTGVVIGETTTIGKNVKLYQGVTLGAKSFPLDEHGNPIKGIKRHPDIQDNVVVYSGATILGGDTVIGHDSIIGGNVWLTHSVPPYTRVYADQPSPIIKQNGK